MESRNGGTPDNGTLVSRRYDNHWPSKLISFDIYELTNMLFSEKKSIGTVICELLHAVHCYLFLNG